MPRTTEPRCTILDLEIIAFSATEDWSSTAHQMTLSEARIRAREAFLNRRGVATARTDAKGTHLVAMRDLSVGEIVLDSPPVCCVLSKEGRCEQCFEKESKVPLQHCSGCKTARYCSKECQAEAWSRHHKYECCISAPLHKALDQVPSHVRQELHLLVVSNPQPTQI